MNHLIAMVHVQPIGSTRMTTVTRDIVIALQKQFPGRYSLSANFEDAQIAVSTIMPEAQEYAE